MQGAQKLFTEDQDGIEKTQVSHKITKLFLSKVCYVFLGLTFAFILVSIIWKIQSKTSSESGFVIPPADADTLEVKSNRTCPVWSLVGDGYCDDEANIPECGHDFNDCCQLENDRSACQYCSCFVAADKRDKFKEKNCLDYLFLTHLGDGTCDLNYNKAEYFFDVGDCCQEEEICQNRIIEWGKDLYQDFNILRDCPENPCIQSNNFCIQEELGDGICQDHNNGPFCDYDMGDCCLVEVVMDECCNCACSMGISLGWGR